MPADLRLNSPRNTADTGLRFGTAGGPPPPPPPPPFPAGAGLTASFGLPWRPDPPRRGSEVAHPATATASMATAAGIPWQAPAPIQAEALSTWTRLARRDGGPSVLWGVLPWRHSETRAAWAYPPPRRREDRLPWEETRSLSAAMRARHAYPARREAGGRLPWADGRPVEDLARLGYQSRPDRRRHERRIPWEDGLPAISLWPRPDHWTPPPPPPRVITPDLLLRCRADGLANLLFGRVCVLLPDGQTIPIRRVYLVIHDIALIRLADNHPIPAARLSLSLDADAWAWQASGTLLGKEALDAVLPGANGEPAILEARIDDYRWQILVEEWTEDRQSGRRGINFRGRGLSAWLAVPYELPGSGINASAMTAQQLMAAHFPIGQGWTLDWQATDWLIPAGAWSWQALSPIQAIHAIAQSVGYVVRPARDTRALRVQPRYPVLPWNYATVAPDLVIPDAAILGLTRRQTPATQANAVFVHGGETGGVLARVRRSASAGDRLAATASHNLITHADAARALGSRILAAQERQPEVRTLSLPAGGPDFPLAQIGHLIRVELGGASVHGIANAVSIEVSRGEGGISVRQTLTLGEDTPNQWARFRRLLPGAPLLAGRVDTVHADGTATVVLLDGGLLRVRGGAAVGQQVYVRGGMIEGDAPALSLVEIEV